MSKFLKAVTKLLLEVVLSSLEILTPSLTDSLWEVISGFNSESILPYDLDTANPRRSLNKSSQKWMAERFSTWISSFQTNNKQFFSFLSLLFSTLLFWHSFNRQCTKLPRSSLLSPHPPKKKEKKKKRKFKRWAYMSLERWVRVK